MLAFETMIDCLNSFFLHDFASLFSSIYTTFAQNLSVFLILKFLLVIGFLILIRGGTPRYRYDYLTKLGWLKFIGLVLASFLGTLTLYIIM